MTASTVRRGATILVTGAGGFLGGRIAERLVLEYGATVRVLLRSLAGAAKIATLPVEYRRGDVTDLAAVTDAAKGCDVVMHCASRIEPGVAPEATTTFLGTRTVAYACSMLRAKLVHISSSSVYGIPSTFVVDETAPHRPRHRKDTYALAKIAAERLLQQCCKDRCLEAAILQPTMIFGPHSVEWTLTPLSMLQLADIAMAEDDKSVCNAVYVDDVVTAAVLAANACDTTCQSYLINGKHLLTWTDYLSRHAAMGTPGKIVVVSRKRLEQLRGEASRSRSVSRTLIRLLRDQPEIRSALLSTRVGGGAFSLLQKYGSRRLMASIRHKLTGRREQGPPTIAFPKAPSPPLRLPPQHFLDLATQTHRYSSAKAERKLAYVPHYSVDTALPRLKAWAEWSRLIGNARQRPPFSTHETDWWVEEEKEEEFLAHRSPLMERR
jgi:nucleoside-diphosphate-sugar epimerase